jgi:hypothetical protein
MPDDRLAESKASAHEMVAPVVDLLAPGRNPVGAVYGTLTVGVLLAAEASRAETYARTIEAIAAAMVLYWLAHAYAHLAGDRLSKKEGYTVASVLRSLRDQFAIVLGALIPFAAVVCAWAANARLSVGITAGIWSTVGVLLAIELIAGLRAHLGPGALVVQTSIGALFGVTILVLRSLLH